VDPRLRSHRCIGLALLGALAAGCGSTGEEGSAGTPSSRVPPVGEPALIRTALPSRTVDYDHFALEGAVGSLLSAGDGVDGADSTTWALHGDGVELRLEIWTWFSSAEAELNCRLQARGGAEPSLALSSPTWTTDQSMYLTQGADCVRVTVLRGRDPDGASEMAVAILLIAGPRATPEAI
jgi:hypothetical protein